MADQQGLVEQLFGAALELSPAERAALLDRVCAHQPQLRRRVEALLRDHERAGSFLEKPLLPHALPHPDELAETVPTSANGHAGERSPSLAARFQAGEVLANRFAVIRFIAHGGMGEVYEVEDRLLQNVRVALKAIRPQIAAEAGSSHRLEQEVILARQVAHPNLCPIYDFSRDPLFFTMKLLGGQTLAERLRAAPPLTREETVSIFRQLAAGVAAMHAAGIIHRDLKPNNIMLDRAGAELCVSIMDFGLARLHEAESTVLASGFVAGTPGYLAPELFHGHRPSQATDLYALGVALHQVLLGVLPGSKADTLPAEPSSALAIADAPATLVRCVQGFLSARPEARCAAFEQLQAYFGMQVTRAEPAPSPRLTRRRFVVGSTLAACTVAAGFWEREPIERAAMNLFKPLPTKRFVAILNWPSPDAHLKPMLLGVIDAIESELSRAEASDPNLFVIADKAGTEFKTAAQLDEVRESLGANLVLAAYCVPHGKDLLLSLRVLEPSSSHPLREAEVHVPADQQTLLPEKAVEAAATLLNVTTYKPDDQRARPGTHSPEAFTAFQAAESLMKQPNDAGLNAAIEKYKEAVDLDPHYADAYARLAQAYGHFYGLRGDTAAIALARSNANSALRLDPNSVNAYTALAWMDHNTGDEQGAAREIAKALSLDPSRPNTLTVQGQIFTAAEQWAQAEAALERALRLRPNYWYARNELGVALHAQGKYAQAMEQFRAASLAAPTNANAFSNLGGLYFEVGNLQEGLRNAKKSFALSPNDEAAITIAAVYRVQRDHANAIASGETAVRLAPEQAVDWLELGDCYAAAGDHKAKAIAAYARAVTVQEDQLRTDPNDGPGWMLLALCKVKANQREGVAQLIAKAESLRAGDMDSQLYKVRILELMGHRVEALVTAARCLQRGASKARLDFMPDMDVFRSDAGYRKVLNESGAG